jgi:hypothetical protein
MSLISKFSLSSEDRRIESNVPTFTSGRSTASKNDFGIIHVQSTGPILFTGSLRHLLLPICSLPFYKTTITTQPPFLGEPVNSF